MRKEDEEFTAEARSLPIDANGGRVARAKAQRRRRGRERDFFDEEEDEEAASSS
jgi:hypothetical protein